MNCWLLAEATYEQIRRVSDRYLYEERDIRLALQYGDRALDRASAEELAVSAEDSWLMMALKLSRTEETEDDRNDI